MITVLIFPSSCQKLVTTALPSKTIQEGCNQKDLRLFVSSSPSSNDKETPWFAPKSLLHYHIKLLSALFPIKKNLPTPLNYPLLLESFDKIQEKNLWKKLDLFGKKLFKNFIIISKFLKSHKLRKPKNFVPISWSIWQGPRISG